MSAAFTSVGLEDEVVAIVRFEIAIFLEPIYGEQLKVSVQEWRCDWQFVSEGRSKEIWLPGAGDVFGSFGPANPAVHRVVLSCSYRRIEIKRAIHSSRQRRFTRLNCVPLEKSHPTFNFERTAL